MTDVVFAEAERHGFDYSASAASPSRASLAPGLEW
jgi:hypothetical protein